jgi:hypothetical protein
LTQVKPFFVIFVIPSTPPGKLLATKNAKAPIFPK